jgi:UDP-GlcNAc3NAcA epimerase
MYALLVIGTRPQIVKSAPLLKEANRRGFDLDIVHTGQHYDYELSKVFFNELSMPDPVENLGVGSGSHGWQTGEMLKELEKAYLELDPDVVLVPGDTNSTLAGALAAAKMDVPVAHIESGCRSFDMGMPEEVNRRLTDHCSDLLYCVSEWARDQLLKEGIDPMAVSLVGDTMYESVVAHRQDIDGSEIIDKLGVEEPFLVLTVHRAENTDDETRLKDIFETVMGFEKEIIFPCHPRTKNRLGGAGLLEKVFDSSIRLVDPVGYYSMLRLIRDAELVLTDSGGVQKEAYWLETPCVTLRDNTEWRETIELGWNRLVGADPVLIKEAVEGYLADRPGLAMNPYDYGGASEKIIDELLERYG